MKFGYFQKVAEQNKSLLDGNLASFARSRASHRAFYLFLSTLIFSSSLLAGTSSKVACLLPENPESISAEVAPGLLSFKSKPGNFVARGGRQTWSLIDKGFSDPSQFRSLFVSALPSHLQCWSQLNPWSQGVFELETGGSSWWSGTQWKVQFRVLFSYGLIETKKQNANRKSTKVKGAYLGYVTVIPLITSTGPRGRLVKKADLNADIRVLGIYNTGTEAEPIATVDLVISHEVSGKKEAIMVQINGLGMAEKINF